MNISFATVSALAQECYNQGRQWCSDATCALTGYRCPDQDCLYPWKNCSPVYTDDLRCYSTDQECDGYLHCTNNGKDELLCASTKSRSYTTPQTTTKTHRWDTCWDYTCDNGWECYDTSAKCDRFEDCADGSDEWNCEHHDSGIGNSIVSSITTPIIIIVAISVTFLIIRCYRHRMLMNRHCNNPNRNRCMIAGAAVAGAVPPPTGVPRSGTVPPPPPGITPQSGQGGYPNPAFAQGPPAYEQYAQYPPPPQAGQTATQDTNKPYPVQQPFGYPVQPYPTQAPPSGMPTQGYNPATAPPVGEGIAPSGDLPPPPAYEEVAGNQIAPAVNTTTAGNNINTNL